ncbi:hypothetical protein BST81_05140 [Leptolyngbya sp. 'hensonii']|uniref:pilus assembly FimT family protein n=1 Tax=Leptolyngbya sp. 'hensonii' TaxID=1922337 RepID=UPI00094F8711|nr:prepilin-type N-terminal cleavage/methylation domain-containing protein [Leptolyngbya sp. 'hensonii']OLP19512.1 hypothetical protein BST81_05140 [Leptolyngbya sp. 'hensonii']
MSQHLLLLLKSLQDRSVRSDRVKANAHRGFTLIELLIVVVIIGVIAAASVPGYLTFINRSRINTVQDNVLRAIKEAQSKAQTEKNAYSVSFRERSGIVEYAVHRYEVNPYGSTNPALWKKLTNSEIKQGQVILRTNINTATSVATAASTDAASWLQKMQNTPNPLLATTVKDQNFGTITFDSKGALPEASNIGDQGLNVTVALRSPGGLPSTQTKRCVILQTIIATLRPEREGKCLSW